MAMDTNEFTKIFPIVTKLENKYGSIVSAPEDDPDFIKLRKICPEHRRSPRIRADTKKKIIELIDKGYTGSEISRRLHINSSDISHFVKMNKLHYKHRFRYRIVDSSGTVYYSINLAAFVKSVFGRTIPDPKRFLKMHYYQVRLVNAHWFSIPVGAYFYLAYLEKPVMKTNEDSYIFADTITNY